MKTQDDRILLRLAGSLTAAVDQTLAENFPELSRSEFFRRAIRFTIDNLEQFKKSDAATVSEKTEVESVAKINAVRDAFKQLYDCKELLQKEPQTPLTIKQLSFLIYLIGEMIFKMNEV